MLSNCIPPSWRHEVLFPMVHLLSAMWCYNLILVFAQRCYSPNHRVMTTPECQTPHLTSSITSSLQSAKQLSFIYLENIGLLTRMKHSVNSCRRRSLLIDHLFVLTKETTVWQLVADPSKNSFQLQGQIQWRKQVQITKPQQLPQAVLQPTHPLQVHWQLSLTM